MARYDRYILSQLLVLFGFFSLVLVAVFWINRAVSLFDRLINNGQTALVFLEFTVLGLPKLITMVLPLSTFAASVYITNKLNTESELTVMQATGASPWRLVRPVVVFGCIVAVMVSILSHLLVPLSQARLSEREAEISHNITARLLTEGAFLKPASGVTFYTRHISEDGVLHDVFLDDRRNPEEHIIYTASQAYLVRYEANTNLIMIDGLAQRLSYKERNLSTANFKDFSFNISTLVNKPEKKNTSVTFFTSFNIITQGDAVIKETAATAGQIAEELHSRFARTLFCIVAAVIGFSTLLLGGFSRFGVWREVAVSFALLIGIDGLRNPLVQPVIENASLWPLMYLPALSGGLICTAMLCHASYPQWWRWGGARASV